jgi:hypothetical protein
MDWTMRCSNLQRELPVSDHRDVTTPVGLVYDEDIRDAEAFYSSRALQSVQISATSSYMSSHAMVSRRGSLRGFFLSQMSDCELETSTNGDVEEGHRRQLLRSAFEQLDRDSTGLLTRDDLRQCFLEAGKVVNMKMIDRIVEAAIDALLKDGTSNEPTESMEDEDKNNHGMNLQQFMDMFHRHPDLYRIFDCRENAQQLCRNVNNRSLSQAELTLAAQEDDQVWFKTTWKNNKVNVLWTLAYLVANVLAFATKAYKYSRDEQALAVFGGCIAIARGSAQCLNLNAALILLPMARHLVTRVRQTQARHYFPFDNVVTIHIGEFANLECLISQPHSNPGGVLLVSVGLRHWLFLSGPCRSTSL